MKAKLPSLTLRWKPARLSLLLAAVVWVCSAGSAGALGPMATTEIVAVEGSEVVLGAGTLAGLNVASQVTLLRESEPIIHPLTGEVLGVPQEPVGTVHIFEASEHRSRGGIVKQYSKPVAGDLAEFRPVTPPKAGPAVSSVLAEMEELKATMAQVRAREDDLRSYPAFARKIWDEVSAMRAYLTSIDERLVEIEAQQSEDHFRLSSVLSGEHRQQDYKEFTVRYAPDTEVRLRAAGKTLLIEVVGDSLQVEELATPVSMMAATPKKESAGLMAMFGFGGDGSVDESSGQDMALVEIEDMTTAQEAPWYATIYHLIAGIGLTVALVVLVILVIKRRYSDVMDGLEDFDDEYDSYLEDEDDEDEDDDDE